MATVDKKFETKRASQGRFNQRGSHTTTPTDFRVPLNRIRLYERVYKGDPTVKTSIDNLCTSIVTSIGEASHPDPEIADFLDYNIKRIEDTQHRPWVSVLHECLRPMFWAGFSVSEALFEIEQGTLYLEDFVTYHPSTILIRTDRHGRLNEGKKTVTGYRTSGIYQQPGHTTPEKRLPLWKVLYLANQVEYGNYYGQSLIVPIYKWYRLKETLLDMFVIALDRYGHPLIYIKTPSYPTSKTQYNPATGQDEPVYTDQEARKEVENLEGNGNVLFFPYNQEGLEPEIGSLTTGNNIGETFLSAIRYIEHQMVLGLYYPYFLVSDQSDFTQEVVERQMEQFYQIKNFYWRVLTSQVAKTLHKVVLWNFNRESAKTPPFFNQVQSNRPEDLLATMQMLKGLTEDGWINPKNEVDWRAVRQMVKFVDRNQDNQDLSFIKRMLEDPKKPKDESGVATKESSPNRGRKGKGTSQGRPSGVSSSQVNRKQT